MGRFVLSQHDTLPWLDTLPAKCVDVTITDPPYSQKSRNARSVYDGRASKSSLGRSALGIMGSGVAWHLETGDVLRLATSLLRVSRRWIVCFCALEQLGLYEQAAKVAWVRSGMWVPDDLDDAPFFFGGLWDRNNTGTPQLSADRPAQGAEGIAIMHAPDVRKRWNGGGSRGIWRHSVNRTKGRHPNKKPDALCAELVKLFSEPGETVFDPYCGEGTIGVAALSHGRNYIGNDAGSDDQFKEPWIEKARRLIAATG